MLDRLDELWPIYLAALILAGIVIYDLIERVRWHIESRTRRERWQFMRNEPKGFDVHKQSKD